MDLTQLVIDKVVAVNRVNRADGSYSIRNRPHCALCYKASGYSEYTHNGKRILSDKNHIIFIPRGATYSYHCFESGECTIIDFEAQNIGDEPCSYVVKNDVEILGLLGRIERMHTFRNQGYSLYCKSGLYTLLYYMVSQSEGKYTPSLKKQRIAPGISYLEKHYNDGSLNISELSDASGISEVYFRKIFTEVYGVSPKRYILQIRMAKARDLLILERFTIQQIAEEVGFNEPYSFLKAFRKIHGCTPTEYRKFYYHDSKKKEISPQEKDAADSCISD